MARTYKGWTILQDEHGVHAVKGKERIHEVSMKMLVMRIDKDASDKLSERRANKLRAKAEAEPVPCCVCGKQIGENDVYVQGHFGKIAYCSSCFNKEFMGASV